MTAKTAAQINTDASTLLANNTTRQISAEDVRQRIADIADSIPSIALPSVFRPEHYSGTATEAFVAACTAAAAADGEVWLTEGEEYTLGATVLTGNLRLRGRGTLNLSGSISLPSGAAILDIDGPRFVGGGVTHSSGTPLTKVRVFNSSFSGALGLHLNAGASDVAIGFNNFTDLHAATGSCQAVRIGNNTYATAEASIGIRIYANNVDGVTNDTAGETHAFLVYGKQIAIFGNTVTGVYHSDESACEAIYTKGVGVSITGNTILDCGPSEDGCISLKGTAVGETSAPNGSDGIVSGNTIAYRTNITTRVIGITIHADKSSANDNTLINCCIDVLAKSDGMVSGNNITIAADGYTPTVIDVDGATNLVISGNRIRIVSTNLNLSTILALRVRAATAAITGFEFSGNTCVVEYNGVTTGGTNATAFLDLFADQAALDAVVANNNFTVKAPNIGSADRITAIFFHGTQTLLAKLVSNIAATDSFAAAELYKDSASSSTITETGNLEAA